MLRRALLTSAAVVAALLVGAVLYLTFGDLSVYKPHIEKFVSEHTGRSFQISGPFDLKVFPAVAVSAQDVRLGNASWSKDPAMIQVGRFSTEVGLWSLVSGPIDVRSLEVHDVTVLLEKNTDGAANWVMQTPAKPEPQRADEAAAEVPAIIQHGEMSNLRVIYREPGKSDRVALLNTLSVEPGASGLLAIAGDGALNEFKTTLKGEIGPIDALASGRDIRMDMAASVGNLALALKGAIGRLHPLDGADLNCKLENPDVATMLKNLQLPVVATGALKLDATLKDNGERTGINVAATLGDIEFNTTGSLQELKLAGADLKFDATVADAARLAAVFDVDGIPKEPLQVDGHLKATDAAIELDALKATLAGAEVQLDGIVPQRPGSHPTLNAAATVANLARLRTGWPEVPVKAQAKYLGGDNGFEIQKLQLQLKETQLAGTLSFRERPRKYIEADISSPRLDLRPFSKKKEQDTKTAAADSKTGKEQAGGTGAQKDKYVFDDQPLPIDKLNSMDGKVRVKLAELLFDTGTLKDVTGALDLKNGQLSLDLQAQGGGAGTIRSAMRLEPSHNGADLTLQATIRDVRTGLLAAEGEDLSQLPTTNLDVDIRASGKSPRQMAAGANGKVLLTEGEGRVKSGAVNLLGSDILSQIGSKLNPFSEQDKVTVIECSVAQAQIVDGQVTIKPVLMQSDKVTVVGHGSIDLDTEHLTFDFNTRPRKGIGISAGMFANPFINVGGTLAHPHLGTGAKGVASGAVAVATGGVSILAKGLTDRVVGEADVCPTTLAEVHAAPATTQTASD